MISTYKRLRIVSIPFKTAQDSRTIIQTEAKAVFFHREFGIKAGLPFFSRQFIQIQNTGIIIPAAQSKTIFSGVLMLDGLSVMVL